MPKQVACHVVSYARGYQPNALNHLRLPEVNPQYSERLRQ
jgi:hypothetical protein